MFLGPRAWASDTPAKAKAARTRRGYSRCRNVPAPTGRDASPNTKDATAPSAPGTELRNRQVLAKPPSDLPNTAPPLPLPGRRRLALRPWGR